MRNRRILLFSPAFAGVLMIAGALSAHGQGSAIRSGSVEIGPFVGGSYGFDKFHVMAGGNITYALKNKWVLPYFEYSYFPGIPHQSTLTLNGGALTHNYTLPFSDVHGGVHVRLPVFGEKPVIPYLVFGVGTLIYPSRTDTFSGTVNGTTIPPQNVSVSGGSDFTINGGGGIRYYLGRSGTVGFRTEAKFYKIVDGAFSGTTFGKVELGFFIQLH